MALLHGLCTECVSKQTASSFWQRLKRVILCERRFLTLSSLCSYSLDHILGLTLTTHLVSSVCAGRPFNLLVSSRWSVPSFSPWCIHSLLSITLLYGWVCVLTNLSLHNTPGAELLIVLHRLGGTRNFNVCMMVLVIVSLDCTEVLLLSLTLF